MASVRNEDCGRPLEVGLVESRLDRAYFSLMIEERDAGMPWAFERADPSVSSREWIRSGRHLLDSPRGLQSCQVTSATLRHRAIIRVLGVDTPYPSQKGGRSARMLWKRFVNCWDPAPGDGIC